MPSSQSPSCQALRRLHAKLSVGPVPAEARLTATKQTQLLFRREATKLSVGPVPAEAATDSYQANSTTLPSQSNQALRRPCAGGSSD